MKLSENFVRSEFACRCGCGFDVVDAELIAVLEDVRAYFGAPVTITSGCRCEFHNSQVGGSAKSKHRLGKAADFKVEGVESAVVADYLRGEYPNEYGIGEYGSWTHIDVRAEKARWSA